MSRRGRVSNPISLFSFQDIITSVTAIIILLTLMLCVELVHRKLNSPAVQQRSATASLRQTLTQAIAEKQRLQAELRQVAAAVNYVAGVTGQAMQQDLLDTRFESTRLKEELQDLDHKVTAAEMARLASTARQSTVSDEQRQMNAARAAEQQIRAKIAELRAENRRIFNQSSGSSKTAWLIDIAAERFVAFCPGAVAAPVRFEEQTMSARILRLMGWTRQQDANHRYFVLLVRPSGIDAFEELRAKILAQGYDFGFDLIGESQVIGLPEVKGK